MYFTTDDGGRELAIDQLVIAGWTGRDEAGVQHHIDELSAIGVSPPSQVPLFYRVSASLATMANALQVLGDTSSGEAEPLLIQHHGEVWLGLGSDHTDRALEAYSVAASKQACGKPLASTLWRFDEVVDQLDDLILTSSIEESGQWVPYQEGTLASIRPLNTLIEGAGLNDLSSCPAMLCGTLPAIGGVRPAGRFRARLEDPIKGRYIELEYAIEILPSIA